MGLGRGGAAVAHDGERQPVAGWRDTDRGGYLSVDANQVCVFATLPLAAGVSHGALATRHARSAATGAASRSLLRGLLLGTDAPAVRRRRDESAVDRRHHCLRARGETRAVPRAGRAA